MDYYMFFMGGVLSLSVIILAIKGIASSYTNFPDSSFHIHDWTYTSNNSCHTRKCDSCKAKQVYYGFWRYL
jgi:hypothetical protein